MPETAATICSRRSEIGKLGEPLHLTLIRRRVIGRDAHFERERLVARRAHFNPMRSGVEVQTLEDAVEVVDLAGVIAVDVDLRIARLYLQAQRAFLVIGPIAAARRIR